MLAFCTSLQLWAHFLGIPSLKLVLQKRSQNLLTLKSKGCSLSVQFAGTNAALMLFWSRSVRIPGVHCAFKLLNVIPPSSYWCMVESCGHCTPSLCPRLTSDSQKMLHVNLMESHSCFPLVNWLRWQKFSTHKTCINSSQLSFCFPTNSTSFAPSSAIIQSGTVT